MKLLVIGNSGFIGRVLVDQLVRDGHDVRGMDIRPPAEPPVCTFLRGDIRNPQDIRRAADGTELVINLAAEHKDFGVSTEAYYGVNDVGNQNLVNVASEMGIQRLFFFSSVAVYSPGGDVCETTPVGPTTVYGQSKVAGEGRIVAWAAGDSRRQATILRPCVVFGPRNFGNMYKLIRTIAARRFVMVGAGQNIKSVAYVENLVSATQFLLDRMHPGVEVYNYSDYPQMTAEQLVRQVSTALGQAPPRLRLPLKPVLAAAQVVDIVGRWTGYDFPITANRIRKLNTSTTIISDKIRALGFQPTASIEDAISVTAGWYRDYRRGSRVGRPTESERLTPA